MPPDIGPAAERVLAGCLDMKVSSRWTIAMVDEDAWGIGSSSGGASPSSDREADCDPVPVHTRTRTISVVISDSGSPSHPHNVMSQDSPFPGRTSRGSPSSSRSPSPSELPHTLRFIPASLSSLNDSILGADAIRNISTAANPLARGRPRTKVSPERTNSRSLSPSMAPLTPQDLIGESPALSNRPRTYGTDSLHDGVMGRTRGTSRLRWRRTDLHDIEEISAREKWSMSRSSSRHAPRSFPRDDGGPYTIGRKALDLLNKWDESSRGRSLRAGSQPPHPSSSTSREKRLREIDHDWVSCRPSSIVRDGVREETVGRMKVRSRSVGFDFAVEEGRTRKLVAH